MKKIPSKDFTKNLLKDYSCRNCVISHRVQFRTKYDAESIMRAAKCEAKLEHSKPGCGLNIKLAWIYPENEICNSFELEDGYLGGLSEIRENI
jgi:hypothetical protein